ncbi:RHS repeat-associated core domain-containing protein [Shewanella sp. YLB-07]|uniref:RHS repeat-associated core domain-containing protein n=1 Tax=Shewanella sp. YLB-07 TaxID=2601268 RepID=UPI00128E68FA|nr:RHS repeat-associated core domain-containing protein [Shewanella sp. YLB-07]MPY26945.1 hypothetical protein [Shewanella sp. YLB-07]
MNKSTSPDVFRGTPTISVIDNRGLAVRSVQYNRLRASSALECLITRSSYNEVGQLSGASDPRLFDNEVENQSQINSLTGQTLRIDSVDAGWRVGLLDIEGGVHKEWDELGITRRYAYDVLLHRPLAIYEKGADINSGIEQITERFVYGDSSQTDDNLNLQLIQHYDQGGLAETCSISLTGQPLIQQRQLLSDNIAESDWQGDESDWKGQLGSEVYKTTWGYNALGVMLAQLGATGNRQRSEYDVSGALSASYLLLAHQADEQILVSEIDYNANGQKTFECAGNGVTTTYTYDERDWRLITMLTERPSSGTRSTKLQELNYTYDPVGNILLIEDKAVATRFYKNQRIEPEQSYEYDALYQLISARGRENAANQPSNSSLPTPSIPIPTDSNQLRNYTRTYTYDRGGNLSQIQHAPDDGSPGYTLSMVVSERSNRTLQQTTGAPIDVGDVDNHFDAHGNLLQLEQSKGLTWGRYNQLKQVELTDKQQEVYQYAAQGARIRKVLMEGSNESEVIYLPGLELRNKRGAINETLHVISLSNTGRNQVRLLHWATETPAEMDNDQLRYSLDNHLGSSHLELDSHGDVLTQEEYYPFGGTAVWSAKHTSEAKYKYVRYSGKERDVTGLYYYGYRYYMPWMGRWLNPDPAWTVDGLNLYRMVGNSPIRYSDPDGKERVDHSSMHPYTPINQIAMLGSHDAGTYAFSAKQRGLSVGAAFTSAFKTQKLTLVEQAKAGTTYFDIRVTQKRNGFQFFHGPSSAGDALTDVKALMEYAKNDPDNIYLFKMDLKKGGEEFLTQALSEVHRNLITPNDTDNLGSTPVAILSDMKNIGIMLKGGEGANKEKYWDYGQQKHTKWANSPKVNNTTKVMSDFHAEPVAADRLNIIQTNMPLGLNIGGGVRNNLNQHKNEMSAAVDLLEFPGIISGDYIGTSIGASEHFLKTINRHNKTNASKSTRL